MSKLTILVEDLDNAIEKASATMEMLYQFLKNKDELKEINSKVRNEIINNLKSV